MVIVRLHITFFDDSAKCYMEVQLRTKQMDDIAEIGPANHLGYEKKQESERRQKRCRFQKESASILMKRMSAECNCSSWNLQNLDVNMFAAVNNSLINDGCGLYRGRLILPYEHLSRFQNDLID